MRPAARLVRLAKRFKSKLMLKAGEHVADARSIFQVLLLSASIGSTMIIEADGADENEALKAVAELISHGDADPVPDHAPTDLPVDFTHEF